MDIQTERKLVKKAKESLKAFDELYDYYLPRIYSYILNRTGSKEIAEDLTSQTFIKAMSKLSGFNYKGYTFGAWLYKIAHNNVIDYYRKNKELSLDMEKMETKGDGTSHEKDLEKQMIILEALKELPQQYQEVLTLKFFQELSIEELATVLNCSKNSATVKAHRGLKALEKVLRGKGITTLLN